MKKNATVKIVLNLQSNETLKSVKLRITFNRVTRFRAIPSDIKLTDDEHAKNNPDMRFHVRKVGYDKAGYTVEQIAPLFSEARTVRNILLPKAIVDILN